MNLFEIWSEADFSRLCAPRSLLAFLGVGWYNQQKRADAAAKPPPASTAAEAKTTGAGGSGGK